MGKVLEGSLDGTGRRVAIAASRFNRLVTDLLVAGAAEALRRHGVAEADVDVAWAPGSFELPLVAARLAATGRYAGVVALGAVVRGETAHFDHVAGQAAWRRRSIGRAARRATRGPRRPSASLRWPACSKRSTRDEGTGMRGPGRARPC